MGNDDALANQKNNCHQAQSIGNYAVLAKLGQGGFGIIYRVRSLSKSVAPIVTMFFAESEQQYLRYERGGVLGSSLARGSLIREVIDVPSESQEHLQVR